MKYSKAVEKIEKALKNNSYVEIEYHRKWTKQRRFGRAYSVIDYEFCGKTYKAVQTLDDSINDYGFIIDSVEA